MVCLSAAAVLQEDCILSFESHDRDQSCPLASAHTLIVGQSGSGKDPIFKVVASNPLTIASSLLSHAHNAAILARYDRELPQNPSLSVPVYPAPILDLKESCSA